MCHRDRSDIRGDCVSQLDILSLFIRKKKRKEKGFVFASKNCNRAFSKNEKEKKNCNRAAQDLVGFAKENERRNL